MVAVVWKALASTLLRLRNDLDKIKFSSPVAYVYNPLDYAWKSHETYLKRFAGNGQTILLGMNPGPFGMAQTGVPFGDVSMVRDFLGIETEVSKPKYQHPKREVTGFSCPRSEVSGTRLWGWAKVKFKTPEAFFERFMVINYCPLVFMSETGANVTPDKLAKESRDQLFALCDQALRAQVEALSANTLIGIGKFAEKCLRRNFPNGDKTIGVGLHPSPASPAANRGWQQTFEQQLKEQKVL